MVQPNYGYAKRQREIAKKQAKEEKLKRKNAPPVETTPDTEPAPTPPSPTDNQSAS